MFFLFNFFFRLMDDVIPWCSWDFYLDPVGELEDFERFNLGMIYDPKISQLTDIFRVEPPSSCFCG